MRPGYAIDTPNGILAVQKKDEHTVRLKHRCFMVDLDYDSCRELMSLSYKLSIYTKGPDDVDDLRTEHARVETTKDTHTVETTMATDEV